MEPLPEQHAKNKNGFIGLGVAIALIVAAILFWPGQRLVGEQEFDFGKVTFDQLPHVVEHTFSLQNTSRSPVTVERSTATCGCTQVVTPRTVVEPGDYLDVPVRLRLSQPGIKRAEITVLLHGGGRIPLIIAADAVPKNTLRVNPTKVVVVPERDQYVEIQVNSETEPPPPVIQETPGLTVTMLPWELSRKAIPKLKRPAIWESLMQVGVSTTAPMDISEIHLFVEGQGSLTVPVNVFWPLEHPLHPDTLPEQTEEDARADP